MIAQIKKTETGNLVLKTPYKKDFIDELKSSIPSPERKWDSYHKVWGVSAEYAEVAQSIFENHFGDDEQLINAEIEQIQANQSIILEQQEHIESMIDSLDEAISRYSFNSKSSIKGRMCRHRALLCHSLGNAELPIEELTEIQVRGLAAAVRLIKSETAQTITRRR